jgi:hypothetical protein
VLDTGVADFKIYHPPAGCGQSQDDSCIKASRCHPTIKPKTPMYVNTAECITRDSESHVSHFTEICLYLMGIGLFVRLLVVAALIGCDRDKKR